VLTWLTGLTVSKVDRVDTVNRLTELTSGSRVLTDLTVQGVNRVLTGC